MKAAVYYETGAPSVFKYEDVPDPKLQPNGVLIDVQAVSIEGGDVLNRAGGDMPAKPHIVGYQCAGVIKEVGADVKDRQPGQRVTAFMPHGSHAAMASVMAAQTFVLPDGIDIKEAATVPVPWGTADDCLFEFGHLKSGETVLIQAGGGGVGLAAIQLAKRAGATVLATASSDDKLERLKEFGLDHGINYKTTKFPDEARKLTGGRGVDLVVDSVGGATLQGSLESLAYRGRAITVGNAGRDSGTRPDTGVLMAGNRSLTGVFLGAESFAQPDRVRAMIQRHLDDIAAGKLRVVVDRVFPLSEAAAAHAYIESRAAFGRVVMVP
ncbi:MAG: zinc-binding alcohol dehydrogenase family protein [Chloroflexota bacterium]|nr:zinc-binding alcohol dehydrogenase family protein [Chloroflexota bacterium]